MTIHKTQDHKMTFNLPHGCIIKLCLGVRWTLCLRMRASDISFRVIPVLCYKILNIIICSMTFMQCIVTFVLWSQMGSRLTFSVSTKAVYYTIICNYLGKIVKGVFTDWILFCLHLLNSININNLTFQHLSILISIFCWRESVFCCCRENMIKLILFYNLNCTIKIEYKNSSLQWEKLNVSVGINLKLMYNLITFDFLLL